MNAHVEAFFDPATFTYSYWSATRKRASVR